MKVEELKRALADLDDDTEISVLCHDRYYPHITLFRAPGREINDVPMLVIVGTEHKVEVPP